MSWSFGSSFIGHGICLLGRHSNMKQAAVEIKVRQNGPYRVTGPVRVVDADGNEYDLAPYTKNGSIVLCRCGGSKTKPFCDKSHVEACFRAE
jgi:CDGSH iron-sulfur domain-containing protein 3